MKKWLKVIILTFIISSTYLLGEGMNEFIKLNNTNLYFYLLGLLIMGLIYKILLKENE